MEKKQTVNSNTAIISYELVEFLPYYFDQVNHTLNAAAF